MAIPQIYDSERVKGELRNRITSSLALSRAKQEQYAMRQFWRGVLAGVNDYTNFLTPKDYKELRSLIMGEAGSTA